MSKLFKALKKGLEEAIAHEEGKITLKSETIEIPAPPSIVDKGIYRPEILTRR